MVPDGQHTSGQSSGIHIPGLSHSTNLMHYIVAERPLCLVPYNYNTHLPGILIPLVGTGTLIHQERLQARTD